MSQSPGQLLNRAPLIIMVVSALTLGAAFLFQYGLNLAPCELCLYQRYPYAVAVLLMGMALLLRREPLISGKLMALTGLVLIVNAGIAGYHVGVEQKWWQGPSSCSAVGTPDDAGALLDQILNAPLARCDEVPWSLFGISMAGYNLIIAIALAAFAVLAWRRMMQA